MDRPAQPKAQTAQAEAERRLFRKERRQVGKAARLQDPQGAAATGDRTPRVKTGNSFFRAHLTDFLRRPAGQTLVAERLLLVDVGARGGLPEKWVPATPVLRVIGFEPDPKIASGNANLEYPMEFVEKAVASTVGSRTFYRTQSGYSSSLLKPDEAVTGLYRDLDTLRLARVLTVETTTIDDVARERQLAFVDAIKLDTQGSELEILRGARETLARLAFSLVTEVEFVPLYENQPLFGDVDAFVRSQGFELIRLFSLRHHQRHVERFDELGLATTNGQLVTADALYFRSPGQVATLLGQLDGPARVRSLAGAVVVCLIYGHADYAAHLVEVTAPLLGTEVVEDLYGFIAGYQRALTPAVGLPSTRFARSGPGGAGSPR